MLRSLIKKEIAVFTAHTNLDSAPGGINDGLARLLELKEVRVMSRIAYRTPGSKDHFAGLGRIGTLKTTIPLKRYILILKDKFNINHIRLTKFEGNPSISKVAVCGGSGSDLIEEALNHNADLFITGDLKYHDTQMAWLKGLILADIGHNCSERFFLNVLKDLLEKNLTLNSKKFEVKVSKIDTDPFQIL